MQARQRAEYAIDPPSARCGGADPKFCCVTARHSVSEPAGVPVSGDAGGVSLGGAHRTARTARRENSNPIALQWPMVSRLRIVVAMLLLLALPLQGFAAATMLVCGPGHHRISDAS